MARGLIQLLVENNFTLESLLDTSSSELSKTLGIDEEVATLICKAAKTRRGLNSIRIVLNLGDDKYLSEYLDFWKGKLGYIGIVN